jgi:hypothetical protein
VEEKDEIKKRLGRSPDKGESILYANYIKPDNALNVSMRAKVSNYLTDN